MIKKGTRLKCIKELTELHGEEYITLEEDEIFYQSKDALNPIYKDHEYGNGWKPYIKIIAEEEPKDDWELPKEEKSDKPIPDNTKEKDEWWDEQEQQSPEPQEKKVELLDLEVKEEIKLMMPYPILLEGSVGTGKSTILLELAKELGLKYYASVLTDQTSKNEFTGYKNVMNGDTVRTEFREAVEFGGMYVLEEINASTANTTIIFNTIDNGFFIFADKIIEVHPDFRLCATMNTITNAKDFGGRRTLDKSVANRFHKIMVYGDDSRFNKNTIIYKEAVDDKLKANGISNMTTARDCQRFEHMISKGVQTEIAIKKCLLMDKIAVSDEGLTLLKKEGKEWYEDIIY